MTDLAPVNESGTPVDEPVVPPPVPPKRSPGHRGQDVRDTVAELAARAHEISLEAGSKMSGALKDVIGAAAGITNFAVESARDLVQYFVRRGQMTQEEADKLLREAEEASQKRPKVAPRTDGLKKAVAPTAPKASAIGHMPTAKAIEATVQVPVKAAPTKAAPPKAAPAKVAPPKAAPAKVVPVKPAPTKAVAKAKPAAAASAAKKVAPKKPSIAKAKKPTHKK